MWYLRTLTFFLWPLASWSQERPGDFPVVPDDIEVALFARDPLVRNPCAMTFDSKGRLFVGMGPQYRNPKPDTPGDSVWILLDDDQDGVADGRRKFATGLNAIQGLAWRGKDLWIANAPELTMVRDLDGDDVADEYVRVYTDIGNLEHALHGLNFGPDGRLYMSKGNSKGLTELPDRLAPKAFRELWGVKVPEGTPDMPDPVVSSAGDYRKSYHDPADDWGVSGGILRCNSDGSGLEIVSRGFRNPWDICFDDGFNWLGTDNDQTMGDKIFAPFYGAHFGWGHAWSYDWKGDTHLPTAPSSGPLFEGSGAGVIYCGLDHYPEKYRGVFLINDWLRREVYLYRPTWKGALRWPDKEKFDVLAHAGGGRSMGQSGGRAFDPVDIEVGPDGAIWIASWGREYGVKYREGKMDNEGRIYRLWPKSVPPQKWSLARDPLVDLGSHLPVWRTNAQEALVEKGEMDALVGLLQKGGLPKAMETWAHWTLGRIDTDQAWLTGTLNQKIQSLRIQALSKDPRGEVRDLLRDPNPRVRLEAVLAVRQSAKAAWAEDLLGILEGETDRLVNYAIWGALSDLWSVRQRKALLSDKRPAVRRAALLGLLEQDEMEDVEIRRMTNDAHPVIAGLARKRLGGKARFEHRGRPLTPSFDKDWDRKLAAIAKSTVNPYGRIIASTGNDYRVSTLIAGNKLYPDRSYRFAAVPSELAGEAFIQTANHDADASSEVEVTIEIKYPSTLFLADDVRGENRPSWLDQTWEATDLFLSADDPKRMRIYKREVEAGTVKLGANRDGITGRKGNYLLIARPKFLAPDGTMATRDTVLAALPGADAGRGRDLFLSRHGANCASCHQLEGVGQQYAPDLSEIGFRADANFIIESIIDPSANITEGFSAQMIRTREGKVHSGIILQETGREVTLAMTGGVELIIPRSEIVERKGLDVSAMPAGFHMMLRSQQIADITAYLLTQKKVVMKPGEEAEFEFRREGDQLGIMLGKTSMATYLMNDPVLTRRAFINVRTPSGIQVTRGFPAPQGDDHAQMHPGLWMGFGWISGNDYWRLQSKVTFEKFLVEPKAEGRKARFATRNRYLNRLGKGTVCFEDTRYRFSAIDNGVLIEIDASYYNDERDFEFGDQEESGLAIRMAKPLTVEFGNGQITNDQGDHDGKGTWGRDFRWIDYSGEINGKRAGILIVPHPENPRPSWSHSRDYGALVANPFPKQPKERREPYVKTLVKKGERFRLRYKVLIHETAADQFDLGALVKNVGR